MEVTRNILIYSFSIVTCIGIPLLIYLIWVKNKMEISIIKSYIDKDIIEQVNEIFKDKKSMNIELKQYAEYLESELFEKPFDESKGRIDKIEGLRKLCLKHKKRIIKTMGKLYDELNPKYGDILHLMHMQKYLIKLDEIEGKLESLIEIEHELITEK
jgi:hypothetical protein